MKITPTLFQTMPPMREPQRRRDPLGFADVAAFYADLLAPGLTNRQRDARWITILCWSLQQVGQSFARVDDAQAKYARLQGLELRWVIQACSRNDNVKGRQLPGSRAINKLAPAQYRALRAHMQPDQWRRYRHLGPYAAYRGLLQQLALLNADGWTLSAAGRKLAAVAATQMPALCSANVVAADDENGWVAYWLRRWPLDQAASANANHPLLPGAGAALPRDERAVITPVLFAPASRLRAVALAMHGSAAPSHAALCGELQRQLLPQADFAPDRQKLAKLAQFAVLADAAIDALRAACQLTAGHAAGQPSAPQIAAGMAAELTALAQACRAWTSDGVWPQVDCFADGMRPARTADERLRQLVCMHEQSAGGLLWLKLRDDKLDRVAQHAQPPGGYYRFRLNALARLATGCKVLGALPLALRRDQQQEPDEESSET